MNKRYDPDTSAYTEAVESLDRLLARFDLLEVTRPIAIAAADIIASL